MFSRERLMAMARCLIWGLKTARKADFKRGDVVVVGFCRLYIELAANVQSLLIKEGIHVIPEMMMTPEMELNLYSLGDNDQLQFLPQWLLNKQENLNGMIMILAYENLNHLKDLEPTKMALAQKSKKPLLDIRNQRERSGDFGWTLCVMPTEALAEEAGMSLEEYEEEVAKICHLDDDPVVFWKNLHNEAMEVKRYLNSLDVDYFHVVSDSGKTDLKVYPGESRQWIGVSGHNIPSFEIYTSPDCYKTEGTFFANNTMFKDGNRVTDVNLEFKDGRVVSCSAKEGEEFLKKQVSMDDTSDMLGEFSLTDANASSITRFMASTLYDENVGGEFGNCHVAIGRGFGDSYCGNKEWTPDLMKQIGINSSAQHWDLISTEKKIVTAHLKDGHEIVIYKDGSFIIPEPVGC
ncbi:MAG: aminopeptidase [Patescibacteria group bacterium]|nr:aminopeptidase [Patescibacteria group bacterium]MDD4304182.1 aminopeptidase [Patescibacteria group bacterium]MDD4695214.1 aminopeptidase [Patescibacteria group bacterium]